jgi:hypothetical protein
MSQFPLSALAARRIRVACARFVFAVIPATLLLTIQPAEIDAASLCRADPNNAMQTSSTPATPAPGSSSAPAPSEKTISFDCITINKGETTTITATGSQANSVVTVTTDNAEIVKVDSGNAQTGVGPFTFTLRGSAGGLTNVHITDSATPSRSATVQVRVILPRFVLSGGVGYSSNPVTTYSLRQAPSDILPTPVPVSGATPPALVTRIGVDEESRSQTPVVFLGHVRLTDNNSQEHLVGLNLYGTIGIGTHDTGVVYGLSLGALDNFFFTVGMHSITVNSLSQGYAVNQIVPAGTGSFTTSSRRQRVFFSLTTSAQNIACIFSLKLTSACASGT